ncbi:hypothetical protein BV401_32905 [Streptomyces malaysiensis subsp. malaysiensis]|uniref:Transposase DDE domain-containing protein n=1 Tax=Streptomyces autolyticus TaxID=75293 RepID=A0ABN4WB79_9ACTN|nr:hypothetical protein BV401_32905 [Streptomyces autolyticus]
MDVWGAWVLLPVRLARPVRSVRPTASFRGARPLRLARPLAAPGVSLCRVGGIRVRVLSPCQGVDEAFEQLAPGCRAVA